MGELQKFSNRVYSRLMKLKPKLKQKAGYCVMYLIGFVLSIVQRNRHEPIILKTVEGQSGQDYTIYLAGYTNGSTEGQQYMPALASLRPFLGEADITFTSIRYGRAGDMLGEEFRKELKENRIFDVREDRGFCFAHIYETDIGRIAVMPYRKSTAAVGSKRDRIRLFRDLILLRRRGADFIIVYIDRKLNRAEKHVVQFLMRAGADYVVGSNFQRLNSGITYKQKNGCISRGVYSLGAFLSVSETRSPERVMIRLKLRWVNKKLTAFEESYLPFRKTEYNAMHSFMKPYESMEPEDLKIMGRIQRRMKGIRSADHILTVGKIAELIDVELPVKYSYLKDFSFRNIAATPSDIKAGDIYFKRATYNDPNDINVRKSLLQENIKTGNKMDKYGSLLIFSWRKFRGKTPQIVVGDVSEAFIKACEYIRKQLPVKSIAITGSIGKTSTKEMLAQVIKLQYKTYKSSENRNVLPNIGHTIQELTYGTEMYIQEMGGGRPGGASRHSRMIQPSAAIVTNIGDAHIGNFEGDRYRLMKNKLEIMDGLTEDGVLYLNGDDPLLSREHPDCKTVFYAIHNKKADYFAENIISGSEGSEFDIVSADRRAYVRVNVPGVHNILNAVCCFAVGKQFGVPEELIVQGIGMYQTSGIRQNLVEVSGVKLYVDCFNASSGSVLSSVTTFSQLEKPESARRFALLGDMTGLGKNTEEAHKKIAEEIAGCPVDEFILYGESMKYAYEFFKAAGRSAVYMPSMKALVAYLSREIEPGDLLMAKGSSKMQLEYVLDQVFGTRFFDMTLLEEQQYRSAIVDGIRYNLFEHYVTAVRLQKPRTGTVHIKSTVNGLYVENIAAGFRSRKMQKVILPVHLRHIAGRAFENCRALTEVSGSESLRYIGDRAFAECVSLRAIHLPDSLRHIGDEAFSGCSALRELTLPESVAQIGENVFADCPNLMVFCQDGSYADRYLTQRNIPHRCM